MLIETTGAVVVDEAPETYRAVDLGAGGLEEGAGQPGTPPIRMYGEVPDGPEVMHDQPVEAVRTVRDERRTTGIVEHDPPAGEHVVVRIWILIRWEDVPKRDQVRRAFEIA